MVGVQIRNGHQKYIVYSNYKKIYMNTMINNHIYRIDQKYKGKVLEQFTYVTYKITQGRTGENELYWFF